MTAALPPAPAPRPDGSPPDGLAQDPPAPVRPAANIAIARADGGKLAENIIHFGRLLRASGLRSGPDRARLAVDAVCAVGIEDPKKLYWALSSVFVQRRSDREVFNQAFVMFWKDPGYLEQMMSLVVPSLRSGVDGTEKSLSRRLSESLFHRIGGAKPDERPPVEVEARGTFSLSETFQTKDFEQMSASELAAARAEIAKLTLPGDALVTRRIRARSSGANLDLRAMVRAAGRGAAGDLLPRYRERVVKRPPLVILCDISGSMETYVRVLLHFVYALTNDRDRVSVFLFGTRLTNVTRHLRHRDPDLAISQIGGGVTDWSGGTRIGASLETFNRIWARRVLGQNATVLLITDGLDREEAEGLDRATRRLSANARRLIWLNPLLRYEGYEPIASGASVLDRHVTEQRPCHNLSSLRALANALEAGRRRGA
ncbi:MAG: VWA domain-containing protein [Hyphomicrobiaceae bacterium]